MDLLNVTTDTGDVTVSLPSADAYAVKVDEHVHHPKLTISVDPASARKITISTHTRDVTVKGK